MWVLILVGKMWGVILFMVILLFLFGLINLFLENVYLSGEFKVLRYYLSKVICFKVRKYFIFIYFFIYVGKI